MPQVYRRHSERAQRPPPAPRRRNTLAPQPTDADDSIVLSDLVRTGEASRLRRRGAMRIDHGQNGAPRPSQSSSAFPPTVRDAVRPSGGSRFVVEPAMWAPPSQTWGPDPSVEDELFGGGEWREWAGEDREGAGAMQLEEGRTDGTQDDDEEGFVLFCGGEDSHVPPVASSSGSLYRPSLFPTSSAGSPTTRGAERTTRRTNGCGALVHMRAFPQGPRGMWVGKREASDVVVGLEADYFESSVVAKMMKSACGCIREGIACAVCGNTLGTRYLPCQAASEGIFSHSTCNHTPASRPSGPAGPQYWRCRRPPSTASTSSARPSSSFYLYTFFADHVSSSPAYAFPEAAKHTSGRAQADQAPNPRSRPASPTYGYRYTASPRPVSPYPALPITSNAPNPAQTSDAAPMTPTIPASIYPMWAQLQPRTPPPLSSVRTPQLALDMPERGTTRTSTGTLVEEPSGADENEADTGMLDADGVLVSTEDAEEPNSPDKTMEMVWPGR